jgi:hypothetical protein
MEISGAHCAFISQNAMKRKGAYASLQAIIEAGGTEASEAIADHGKFRRFCLRPLPSLN